MNSAKINSLIDSEYEMLDTEHLNFTKAPNFLIDFVIPSLGPAETKVVLFLLRRINGFSENSKRGADRISLTQFKNGMRKADGTILNHGCGVKCHKNLRSALDNLEEVGLIKKGSKNASGTVYSWPTKINPVKVIASIEKLKKRTAKIPAMGATPTPNYHTAMGATPTPAMGATPTPAMGATPTTVETVSRNNSRNSFSSLVINSNDKTTNATAPRGASQSDATPEKTSSKSLAVKEYGAVMASHSDIVLALASVEPIFPAEFKNKDKKPYQIKATRTAVASAIAAHGLDVVIKTAADYASPAMRTHKFFKHRPQNTYVFFKNFDAIRDNIASLSPGSNLTEGLKPDPSRRKKPVILVSTNK